MAVCSTQPSVRISRLRLSFSKRGAVLLSVEHLPLDLLFRAHTHSTELSILMEISPLSFKLLPINLRSISMDQSRTVSIFKAISVVVAQISATPIWVTSTLAPAIELSPLSLPVCNINKARYNHRPVARPLVTNVNQRNSRRAMHSRVYLTSFLIRATKRNPTFMNEFANR